MQATTAADYDLDPLEIERVSVEFLAKHPDPTGQFVAVVVGPRHPLAGVGRAVERQCRDEESGATAADYGPYEDMSTFFVVLDRRSGLPAGAGRVIEGHGSAVKTVHDAAGHIGVDTTGILAAHGMTGNRIWDFASVAVLPDYRDGKSAPAVSSLLYRSFLLAGARAEIRHVVAMLDRGAYQTWQLLGAPLEPMAGSEPFGSAETRALYVPFDAIGPGIAAQASRLGSPFRKIAGEIDARGLRRLRMRRTAAGISRRVSSGRSLDRQIVIVD